MESIVFVASKLLWLLAEPGRLLLLALLAGCLLLVPTRGRRGRALVVGGTAGLFALAVLPVGAWLARPLENRFPAPPDAGRVDGIVVLGGAVDQLLSAARGQIALTDAAERVTAAAALARRHPGARLVVSGGEAAILPTGRREADAMADFLVEQGVERARITVERDSRNTHENAERSLAAARPAAGETWLLVTSAMHMPRAVGCFRAVGWGGIVPYPVDYRTPPGLEFRLAFDLGGLALAGFATKEWIGLTTYRALGWTDALLPAP